jgi:hypothetical protein
MKQFEVFKTEDGYRFTYTAYQKCKPVTLDSQPFPTAEEAKKEAWRLRQTGTVFNYADLSDSAKERAKRWLYGYLAANENVVARIMKDSDFTFSTDGAHRIHHPVRVMPNV